MATPEPVIDWTRLRAGDAFPPVHWALHDAWVDAYLAATGEEHELFREAGAAPPLCMALVRFVKAALGGRWPPGTLQLSEQWRASSLLRRNATATLVMRVDAVEQWDGRPHVRLSSSVTQGQGVAACGMAMSLLWPQADAGTRGLPPASRAAPALAPLGGARRFGPVADRFSLLRVRAYADLAAANDPIHVDPDFARTTPLGANIVQGKLVATLISRAMLAATGRAWLDRGRLELRFRRPVLVDEPVEAWVEAIGPGGYGVWCENAKGERVVEGTAAIGA